MKLLLVHPARIRHNAGEIVEVSPAEANFLISVGAARVVEGKETPEKETKTTAKRKKVTTT